MDPDELARFDRLVVQNADILRRIRETKIPALALHDRDQEERIAQAFEFTRDPGVPEMPFAKPSLIVAGRQDAIAGYGDALNCAERYPRATIAVLDTAGHSLAWERPDLFKALALDWLSRLSPAPRSSGSVRPSNPGRLCRSGRDRTHRR